MFNLDNYIQLLASRLKKEESFKKLKRSIRRVAETHWQFERAQKLRRKFGRRRGHFAGLTDPCLFDRPSTKLMALCLRTEERSHAAYYRAQDKRLTVLSDVHRTILDLHTAAYKRGEWEDWKPSTSLSWSQYWLSDTPTPYITHDGLWHLVHKVVKVASTDATAKELPAYAFDIPEPLRPLHAKLLGRQYKVAKEAWFK